MKTKKQTEEKLRQVKEILSDAEASRGIFSYWLGFRRALEWLLDNDY